MSKNQKTELRVVSGSLRGRKIACRVHPAMRPTPQLVREALFSILGNAVPGRTFFDLFAGTGINGLEALSRGASQVRFLERDSQLAHDITKQLQRFSLTSQGLVLKADVYHWIEQWIPFDHQPVNLFLSPPFPDLQANAVSRFMRGVDRLVEKAPLRSVVIIQGEAGFPLQELPFAEHWDIRKYGRNMLLFLVKEEWQQAVLSTESENAPSLTASAL